MPVNPKQRSKHSGKVNKGGKREGSNIQENRDHKNEATEKRVCPYCSITGRDVSEAFDCDICKWFHEDFQEESDILYAVPTFKENKQPILYILPDWCKCRLAQISIINDSQDKFEKTCDPTQMTE